jgi:hypothetical protein
MDPHTTGNRWVGAAVVVDDWLVGVCEPVPLPQADNATTTTTTRGALFGARGLMSKAWPSETEHTRAERLHRGPCD